MAGTHAEAVREERRVTELRGRLERECPLQGPNSIVSAVIRSSLSVGDTDRAEVVLDFAARADSTMAEAETVEHLRALKAEFAAGGFELSEEQMIALTIVGPRLYLEGLYHGRREGANVLQEIQQGQGE